MDDAYTLCNVINFVNVIICVALNGIANYVVHVATKLKIAGVLILLSLLDLEGGLATPDS